MITWRFRDLRGKFAACFFFSCGIVLMLGTAGILAAGPGDQAASIQAHLAAGEFAPAVELARQIRDPKRHDLQLRRIASAQLKAGERNAALATTANIYEDLVRNGVLNQITQRPVQAPGAAGGGGQADFQSLIALIQSTVAPETWVDVGGVGSIGAFPGGVFIDAQGMMQSLVDVDRSGRLSKLLQKASQVHATDSPRRESAMRKISLTRLERRVQLLLAAGVTIEEEMKTLAGLQRIKYVLVYPATGDLVLAGPAGDWETNHEGRTLSTKTGHPVLQLDDLVVVLRHMKDGTSTNFGCSITPTQKNLAKAQQFINQWKDKTVNSRRRKAWLEDLRAQLGSQEIDVFGIDGKTRVGQILVEADYHMKLVGMGLKDGVAGVPSYLNMIEVEKGGAVPMEVLRWWFTLNYDSVSASSDRKAFEFKGQGVQVMSTNELLTAQGNRVQTGKAELLNQQFARNFTKHFQKLAVKYPVYAELQNICDLAMLSALIKSERLAEKVSWHMTCFGDPDQYRVKLGKEPKSVQTIINHRVLNPKRFIVGVSGGVMLDAYKLIGHKKAIKTNASGALVSTQRGSAPNKLPRDKWWWD